MRRMRIVLPVLIIALFFLAGILITYPGQAQSGQVWLPFDGQSQPAQPMLQLIQADPQEIQLEANLPGAYTQNVTANGSLYTRFSGEGYGYPAALGLPDVPVLRREVEIPFGADVSVEIISAQSFDHSLSALGLHPIYPMQPPVPKLEQAENQPPFAIESKYYASGGLYPSVVVSLGEPFIVRGHRILMVEVWPVAYDPSNASLRLYSQVTFRLNLTGSDMARTNSLADKYASPAFDPSLSRVVLNYNQGHPIRIDEQMGFLIISADAYAAALDPLVQLRQSRGFEVTLTRLSEIPDSDTPEGIKAYIQTAYDTWLVKPSYVLLVGDTDTVPAWYTPVISTYTDLYYATMDGNGDWHPDIGRGRFPVRSVEQTTNMVDKYLFYAALTGQEPWLKTASFPATCDLYQVAEGTHNYVIDTWTAPGGWTGTFPTDPNPGGDQLYCVTYAANHAELVEHFNQGRWAIIYSGHGSQGGWEMEYSASDIQSMPANQMYPFVASHACLTGDFGYPSQDEVFGETWVLQPDKGALVYWGSATYSYWDEDDVLERSMFDGLFAGESPHADVTAMTYAGLAGVELAYPGSAQYYWETYNVLGDPTIHLFMEPNQPAFTLDVAPTSHAVCQQGSVASTIEIGSISNYSSTVSLEAGAAPINVAASFDPSEAPAPYTSTLTLDVSAGAPEGDFTIPITATDHVSHTLNASLGLVINLTVPSTPTLLTPPDGATDLPFTPSFDWSDLPLVSSYNFQLARSPLFETPIISPTGLLTSEYTLEQPLEGNTCYWWRAQADNACGIGDWATPFHFSTVNLGVSFFDDMENGPTQWTHSAVKGVDHWAISSDQSYSPSHAWHVPDDDIITDSRLWTADPILLGTGSSLTFWHQYQFEGNDFDGAVLEISVDQGDSWTDLGPFIIANGYNGTINSGYSNPLGGRAGWTGELTAWTQVTVDLGSFAGQSALIRWRIGSDISVGAQGWYIDDVRVTAPLPANPTPTLISISPDVGSNATPTPVEINGTNFAGTPALRLGDAWLLDVVVLDPATITAVVPAGLPVGTYDLAIYNGDCQSAVLEQAFTVYVGDVPISGLVATNDSPTILGELTTFTATVENGTNITYTWVFSDGSSAIGKVVTHLYAAVDTYTATVTASNSFGEVDADTEVTIVAPPVETHLTYLPVTFK